MNDNSVTTVPRDTLIDLFHDLESHRGEFLVYDDGYRVRRYSYEQVTRAARAFAQRLRDAGVKQGQNVVLWGENRPEWIVCYWGCIIAGVVIVPIDYRSSADFLSRVARLVAARVVVLGDDVQSSTLGTPGTPGT
ncbi:MAG TPA: class I adenylate-forming enzyme family protein, partial [Vicinamibacterales bacterium]|nr:class I adenylate-forming enzyme family protein [Vicinamibacterales bacterium]